MSGTKRRLLADMNRVPVSRTTFATGSVTLTELAERVKALLDDLTTHGLIGA